MSFIQKNQLHIDKLLSNVALGYKPRTGFAREIAPIVSVQKQTDLYRVWDQADLWRIDDTLRAPGQEANRISTTVGSDSYSAVNYALRSDIAIEETVNADNLRELEQGRTMALMDKILMDWDRRVALQVTSSSNVGTASNVASAWTDAANSDPFSDILTVMDQIEDATGYRPNKMVAGGDAWRNLRRNNAIIDKVNKTGITGGDLNSSQEQVKDLFDLDKVIVAGGYINTADEGVAATYSRTFGDHILVYYAPERPTIELPSFMYSFRWAGGGLPNMQVSRLPYDQYKQKSGIQVSYYQDEKITSAALGGLISWSGSSQ